MAYDWHSKLRLEELELKAGQASAAIEDSRGLTARVDELESDVKELKKQLKRLKEQE